jgi:hypothetical protein
MRVETDPLDATAVERRREIAALLARGVWRCLAVRPGQFPSTTPLETSHPLPRPSSSVNRSELSRRGLEVAGQTRLSVHAG